MGELCTLRIAQGLGLEGGTWGSSTGAGTPTAQLKVPEAWLVPPPSSPLLTRIFVIIIKPHPPTPF